MKSIKEELAIECANSASKITLDCPREARNPGLYFGFVLGWNAAITEKNYDRMLDDAKKYRRALNNIALMGSGAGVFTKDTVMEIIREVLK